MVWPNKWIEIPRIFEISNQSIGLFLEFGWKKTNYIWSFSLYIIFKKQLFNSNGKGMFYLWLGLRDLFQLFICWYLQMLWCSYICVIYKPVVFSKFTHLWKWKIFLVHLLAMSLNKISKYTHYQLLYLIFIRNLFFVSNEVIICFPNMCVCEFINFLSSIQNKKK